MTKTLVPALLGFAALSIGFLGVQGQNAIVGGGFTNGWNTTGDFEYLSASVGGSYIRTENANGTGNQYFRMGVDWSGTTGQHTITIGTDVQVYPNTAYSLNATSTGSGAMYFNVSSTSDNYIFKTRDVGTAPSHDLIVFEVQGSVQSISSVSQSPAAGSVGSCTDVVVTATRSAVFAAGQSVYIRYSNNGFSTSTVAEMTLVGSDYEATIPASFNTPAASVSYYIFTSGNGLTIASGDADWYTINLNNNGGSNYNYTVGSQINTAATGNWNTGSTWCSGSVPGSGASPVIQHDVTLNVNPTVSNLTINSGFTLTGGNQSINLNSGGTFLVNGTFAGSGTDVNLASGAVLNLANNNTTIGSVSEVGASNSGTVTLGSGTLTIDGVDKGAFFQNSISGTGGLTMDGDGTTVMNLFNAQTFTGAVLVSGTGKLSSAGAFSATSYTISDGEFETTTTDNRLPSGAVLTVNGGLVDLQTSESLDRVLGSAGEISITGGRTLNITPSAAADYGGVISGSGNITKSGTQTWTLSGTGINTITGDLTVSAGTLVLNKSADTKATDDLIINSGATVRTDANNQWGTGTPPLVTVNGTLNGNNFNQRMALVGSGPITMGSGDLTIVNAFSDTYSGIISGTGKLIKDGVGTQILTGANTYTDNTEINNGTLEINGSISGSSSIFLGFGGSGDDARLVIGNNSAWTNPLTVNVSTGSGSRTIEVTGSNSPTLSGNMVLNRAVNWTASSAASPTISGIVSGANSVTVDGGTWTTSGANTYTGNTEINNGTLEVNGSISGSSSIFLGFGGSGDDARLVIGNSSAWTNPLTVNVSTGSGSRTIEVTGSNSPTLSGNMVLNRAVNWTAAPSATPTVSGVVSGSNNVAVNGGSWTIAGTNANTLTGDMTVSTGTLILNKSDDTKATDDLIINSGATVDADANNQWGASPPPLITVNGTLDATDTDQRIALAGSGAVNMGNGFLTIDNLISDTYTGSITAGSTLTKEGNGLQIFGGAVDNIDVPTIEVLAGTLQTNADNIITDATDILVDGGTLNLQNETVDELTVDDGTLQLDASETLTVGALNVNTSGSNLINAAAGSTLVLQAGSHTIDRPETLSNLTLLDGATLTVDGGALTINGTLEIQGSGALSTVLTGSLAYGATAELYYNTGTSITPINEWSPTLTPNTIRIGNNTTVNLDAAGFTATNLTIESSATLALNGFDLALNTNGTLTNNGTFTAGTNAVVFTGTNTVAGGSTTTFYDALLNGSVNFGTNSEVSNELVMQAGGSVNTNRPDYLTGSTLVYATGGAFPLNGSNIEWELGASTNNPDNVEVRTSAIAVDATGGDGLTCGTFTMTSTGGMTIQPPTTGTKPPSFDLLLVDGDFTLTGTSTFEVLDGDGDDLKSVTTDGFYDVKVAGDIDIASTASMTLNADIGDDLFVQGDFTINGTFDPQDRAVYFRGTAQQVLTDNASPQTEFAFVRMQNSSGADPALDVQTDWLIDDQLELNNGIITIATGNTLTLTSNANILENNGTVSYINGRTVQTKVLSGTAPIEISYGLQIDPNNNNLGSTTVTTTSGPDGIQNNHVFTSFVSIAKVWDVVPTTQPTSPVDGIFNWVSAHDNGMDQTDLYGWRKPVGAVAWKEIFGPYDGSTVDPTVSIDSFSGFTFADGGNPLPITLVEFGGVAVNAGVQLHWTTASELNNDYFTVEHSMDGVYFDEIVKVDGAGTTTARLNYGHFDAEAQPGLNYYRLRQTDFDGTQTNSDIIAVRVAGSAQASVYPIPAHDRVFIEWTFQQEGITTLSLSDVTGRIAAQQQYAVASGDQRLAISLSALPAGMYILALRDQDGHLLHQAPVSKQ